MHACFQTSLKRHSLNPMPHNRYYIDTTFRENGSLILEGEEWHHLTRVLRVKPGEEIELVNGRGKLALGRVIGLNKQDAEIAIEEILQETSPPPALILAQGLTRMNPLEWIVEKGTELGVTSFWLFPGVLSEKEDLSPTQKARLRHLCIAAMKQCGRLDLPEIVLKPPLAAWDAPVGTLFFGDTQKDAPFLRDLSLSKPLREPLLIVIGPEKGLAPKERQVLTDSFFAQGVRLHQNILRAETAPLVALSQIPNLIIQ